MHISEGVLSGYPLVVGAVGAAVGVAVGLKKIEMNDIPRVGIVSAALFVASLIHINVGPVSVHLILNGVGGIILGMQLFPAYFVALLLQVLLFQFGGITVLGVNICTMAFSGVIGGYLGKYIIKRGIQPWIGGAIAGGTGVIMAGIFTAMALVFSGDVFIVTAKLVLIAHLPVVVIESIVGGFVIAYLYKIMPSSLGVCKR